MPNSTTNFGWNLPLVNNATDADLWGGQLNSNWTDLDSTLFTIQNANFPISGMMDYAGSSAPSLWQLCYGQTIGDVGSGADVENAGYESVFDLIKVAYGNAGTESWGAGATVLMPDSRGRVSAGQDDMGGSSADRLTSPINGDTLGAAGGVEEDVLVEAELPSSVTLGKTVNGSGSDGTIGAVTLMGTTASGRGARTLTVDLGSGSAHTLVQPTIIFNKIMYMGA